MENWEEDEDFEEFDEEEYDRDFEEYNDEEW